MDSKTITRRVIDELGGQVAVAKVAGVTQQAVGYWQSKTGRIPAEAVLAVEAALRSKGIDITRYDIRPDVYGPKPRQAA